MTEDPDIQNPELSAEPENESMFSFQSLFTTFILNWKWFVFSAVVSLGVAYAYLRYTVPVYSVSAKMLMKEDDGSKRRGGLQSATFGQISNTAGVENELEIIGSRSIALDVVKRLKLYTTYYHKGRITDRLLYGINPVVVEIDPQSLETLARPIVLSIKYEEGKYEIGGSYTAVFKDRPAEQREINAVIPAFPARIRTAVGDLTFMGNQLSTSHMSPGETIIVTITPPAQAAGGFAGCLSVTPTSRSTSIFRLVFTDINPARATDYLTQLVQSYNDDSNNDKNIVMRRTEEFINSRLEKINVELGATEGAIESFKRQNKGMDPSTTAGTAFGQSNSYEQKLTEMQTQLMLFNSIREYMDQPQNRYQTLPSNVGLTDPSATSLINNYNQIVLERNRLLRTASENSPTVAPLTDQLNDLTSSIRRAMSQARNNYEIQRNAMENQFVKYSSQLQQTPGQERILNEIGRQQEVRSGLYLMLLQKREENNISLAATADKGKMIDAPEFSGQVAPDRNSILTTALAIGLALPFCLILITQLLRYKIEGRKDVERLTRLPIIGDIPVAAETAKTHGDIVVHENSNTMMEEVFRSLRTNIQFTLKEKEKTILFTSSTSGEGKTFIAANLAVSLALLDKRIVLVGLDIRKPRLSQLFGLDEKGCGITRLLMHDTLTADLVREQILPSGIASNLDVLPAGPVPPNPAEMIARPALDEVFRLLEADYDYIIIDTAPVGLVTDTLSIGRVAAATIFVSRADYTPKSAFSFFNELADSHKLPKPSVLVNAVDLSKKKYGYYYGYGKYGKYGRYGAYKHYGSYGHYGHYGDYAASHYGKKRDKSIKS